MAGSSQVAGAQRLDARELTEAEWDALLRDALVAQLAAEGTAAHIEESGESGGEHQIAAVLDELRALRTSVDQLRADVSVLLSMRPASAPAR